jgi:hypothetical protein
MQHNLLRQADEAGKGEADEEDREQGGTQVAGRLRFVGALRPGFRPGRYPLS